VIQYNKICDIVLSLGNRASSTIKVVLLFAVFSLMIPGYAIPSAFATTIINEDAKLTALDAAAFDFFGESVSVSGDTAVVGALFDDDAGSQSGSAYVFVKPAGGWAGSLTETAKLTASDAAASDFFGESVSVSGDTAVVGARFDGDACPSNINCHSGSAYVFTRSGGIWTEQAKLTASDAVAGDQFGGAVTVSGGTAVVGARLDDDAGSQSGSAYVFELVPPTPQEAADDLIDDIQDLIDAGTLNGGQGNALISKLQNIIDKLNNGKTKAACNQLGAFINQVTDFINGGTLTSADGQPLIDAAQAIKDAADC